MNCHGHQNTANRIQSRKVSLWSHIIKLSDKVCIDNFYFGDSCLIHVMNVALIYGLVVLVPELSVHPKYWHLKARGLHNSGHPMKLRAMTPSIS